MLLANVWIEHPIAKLNQLFTYYYQDMKLQRGMRVRVSFNSQKLVAFVASVEKTDLTIAEYESINGFALSKVEEAIDSEPLLNDELLELGNWLAEDTISSIIACYQVMLPSKLKPRSSAGNIKHEVFVRFVKEVDNLTARQQEVLMLCKDEDVLRKTMNAHSSSITKKLLELEAVELIEKEVEAKLISVETETELVLTSDQKKALDDLTSQPQNSISLLHGATGSGKTEIYLQLAKSYLERKQQVLILVPEISLTPQMVQRVKKRFGSLVAIYHSGLSVQEKYEQYQLVRQNKVSIVVGTRSAIFMPFNDLGLIVMDEEHDGSYKQDNVPRYHCRDVAFKRAQTHQAKVVLGSATPALETYARALKGVYHLVELPNRINGNLAVSHIVDMSKEMRFGNYIISRPLKEAIRKRLDKKQQVILLLNRRGYTPILRCSECSHVMKCPHCDVALSYHKDDNSLKCHICGHVQSAKVVCPSCGNNYWSHLGFGTQRLQEEVASLFSDAKILRLDADTSRPKGAFDRILGLFAQGEADILVGTQMISKGLDYPNVTLVGILQADALLSRSDYRCVEMTFDLLVQASGRSGRGKAEGEVYLQVYDPTHYVIRTACNQDYLTFFNQEMKYRHIGKYPPYSYFISIIVSSNKQMDTFNQVEEIKKDLLETELDVLGPGELLKKQDLYRYRLLVRGKNLVEMKKKVTLWYKAHLESKPKGSVSIDINPLNLE